MQKLDPDTDGKTMDIVADNIAKLKELFPEIVTEGKVDFAALQEVLGEYVEDREERYSFTWNGKSRARMLAQTPSNGTLRPYPEESVDFDSTQNLFIEGDNLEVLKLLQKSYYGKVKMIYIDPPYNTGGDFIYPDNFTSSINNYLEMTGQKDVSGRYTSSNTEYGGRFHTNWLNMIYPRLLLARRLLADNGAIFISIDDNEAYNLKKICDEIFGEENYIGMISRATGTRMGTGSRGVARELDYLIVYSKTDAYSLSKLPMTEAEMSLYNEEDERGKYLLRSLRRTGGENRREDRPSMYYPVISPDGDEVFPLAPEGWESRWVCGKETYEQLLSNDFIIWKKVQRNGVEKWQVYQKHYMSGEGKESSDLWTSEEGNKKATRDLNKIFDGKKVFDHPKPVGVMIKIIQLATNSNTNDVVLDFFSGSASTCHAVIEQNISDNGDRRIISIQLPEKCKEGSVAQKAGFETIADISKERIRRVIQKVKTEQETSKAEAKGTLPGLVDAQPKLDLGFKVLKLDSTNIKPWDADFDNYESSLEGHITNIKPGRSEEDVLYEILLKYGLDLTLPIEERIIANKKVFIVGLGALVLCLADGITLDVVEGIADLKEEFKPEVMRVVFKDNGFSGSDGDVVKTNAIQILRQHDITDVKSL